ncbi:membrane-bound lytic murein transglycosylase MltF [Paraferrimonas haliotis]|uniref:Membrane-bound lytic murein transglycosylase F n=1 Tax=Paraferrimonas haliotis TaxID=2013866 RepID=A0AA37TRD7_9GAMM|nr:membrane-bound lytic murein transglycosylase MltF [Paraferrimonas haliotis]GLS82902.1 membrane-bound lytic murein transglycosylase F [Paraferrimonas haliotis]
MIRRFYIFVLVLIVSACQPHSSAPRNDQKRSDDNTLIVGTTNGPSTYLTLGKNTTGFDYELVQKFADYSHRQLQIKVYQNLTPMLQDLSDGKLDIVAAGMGYTQLRSDRFLFGPPLYNTDILLVYRSGEWRPRNLDDIRGELVVASRSSHAELLRELNHPNLRWTLNKDYDPEELLSMVANGEYDYTIADESMLRLSRRLHPRLRTAFTIKEQQPIGWMFAPNGSDELISEVLNFWQNQQVTLKHLQEKYFGHTQGFDFVDTRAFIRALDSRLPKYQALFEKYSGDLDWRKIAAISYQESHWRPHAKSPTGVRGMMMLTLPTAKQMGVDNRLDAEQSIRGGSAYMNHLVGRIPESIPESERLWFALAAYNIGFGHMEDGRVLAQKQGLNPSAWADVKTVLPLLEKRKYYQHTRHGYARGSEAVHYVNNIRRYYDTLVYLQSAQEKEHEQEQHSQSIDQNSDPSDTSNKL